MGRWNLSSRTRESLWSFSWHRSSQPRWLKATQDEWGFRDAICSTRAIFRDRRGNNSVRFCVGKRPIFPTIRLCFTNVLCVFFYWDSSSYLFIHPSPSSGSPCPSVSFLFIWSLRGSNFRTSVERAFRSRRRLCDRREWGGRSVARRQIEGPLNFLDWWDKCSDGEIWEGCSCYNYNINRN